ncbi:MAG: phosphatase PAP2 family protein [Gemmatimonadales bacterium]|nr:phosphatase PAP2 family protein [Gemmatimonadales bacterium]
MTSSPAPAPDTHQSERLLGVTLLVGLAAAVIVLVLLTWLAREMLEGETIAFDTAVRNAVHGAASSGLTRFMRSVTLFGGPRGLAPAGLVLVIVFWRLGWRRAAVLLPVTMIGAGLVDAGLKLQFGRARPAPFFDYPLPTSYSFPSGHALLSFSFFAVLAALLSPRVKSPAVRLAIWIAAVIGILLVSVSRVYLGVHYPSDVVAGWGAGFVWVVMVAFGDRLAHRMKHRFGIR